jgi:hypothetical protein
MDAGVEGSVEFDELERHIQTHFLQTVLKPKIQTNSTLALVPKH